MVRLKSKRFLCSKCRTSYAAAIEPLIRQCRTCREHNDAVRLARVVCAARELIGDTELALAMRDLCGASTEEVHMILNRAETLFLAAEQ